MECFYTCTACGTQFDEPTFRDDAPPTTLHSTTSEDTPGCCPELDWDLLDGTFWTRWTSFNQQPSTSKEETYRELQLLYDKKFKGSYNRRAHINERLYAHCLREPAVPAEHHCIIQEYMDHYIRANCGAALAAGGFTPSKRDIQRILRSLDKSKKHPEIKWCKKYLERWKSIAEFYVNPDYVFSAEMPTVQPSYNSTELAYVGQLFMAFSNLWDRWQPPSQKFDRSNWRWPDRKHFPNFNYMFRKIHALLGYTHHDPYFPLPVSSTAKLDIYYNAMCKELGITVPPIPKQTTLVETPGAIPLSRKRNTLKPFHNFALSIQRSMDEFIQNETI